MGEEQERIAAFVGSWGDDPSESVAWEARAFVDELSKSGRHDDAVELGERSIAMWPEFDPLRSCLGWAYYRRDVSGIDKDADAQTLTRAKKAQERIVQLASSDPYGKYSAMPLSTITVARSLSGRSPAGAVELLESLDPNQLATAGGEYRSHYAQWFTSMAKSLADAERWEQVLEFTSLAEKNPNLNTSDLESVRWNRVRALEATGRTHEAMDLLSTLRRSRSQWWFDACQARLSESVGAKEDAMSLARLTLNHPGDLASRWSTVAQLGRLLSEDDPDLAGEHLLVAQALRAEKGWKPDADLERLISARELMPLQPDDVGEVIRRLRGSWRIVEEETLCSGTVKALLPGGGSGFIIDDDGVDIYFSMGRNGGDAPAIGTRVTFRVVEGFDQKKQQPSSRAVRVKPFVG